MGTSGHKLCASDKSIIGITSSRRGDRAKNRSETGFFQRYSHRSKRGKILLYREEKGIKKVKRGCRL